MSLCIDDRWCGGLETVWCAGLDETAEQSHPNLHTQLSSIQSDIYQMLY